MQVMETRVLRGPSIHSEAPSFLVVVELEQDERRLTRGESGFGDRLFAAVPGLESLPGEREGVPFRDALAAGTTLAHVLEHVLVALQVHVGGAVSFSRTSPVPARIGQYQVVVGYESEQVAEMGLEIATDLLDKLWRGETVADWEERLEDLKDLHARRALGPSTGAIIDAARRRNIPVFRMTENASLFQLGWGKSQKRIQATITSETSYIAVQIAQDKDLTKVFLDEAGLPTPRGEIVRTPEGALAAARRLGGPVVIKPYDGNQGKGVSLNLTTPESITAAFALAREFSRSVLVEQYVIGQDYRVLVVGTQVIAAARRFPAQVVGDGARTVRELVEEENRNPLRGHGHEKPLTLIKLDESARQVLERQQMTFESVPAAGQVVVLKENANLSTGGSAEDVTDTIHPQVASACVSAARKVGLDVAGIDLVCEDISRPLAGQSGAIIEVNAAPGIRMHQHPSKGEPHDVGKAIVDALFPPGTPTRIPVIAVTGTNGKTTTTLAIGHTIQNTGTVTGVTTTEGIYIDGRLVSPGDCTGYWSARTVLTSPNVEAAVLETARGGMFKRGLAFDLCDVGVVLNVSDDHLGQHGAETLEDLARVKSLLVRAATQAVVLNADDARVVSMTAMKRPESEILFFSLDHRNPVLESHLDQGGRAVYLRGRMIMLGQGLHRIPLVEVARLPFTLQGRARHNVANAMAAAAALLGAGYTPQQIVAGLSTFSSTFEQNPGRLNLFQVRNFTVLVDYAHNAESYRTIIETARQFPHERLIGVVAAPGDRYSHKIQEIGRLCGDGFDELVIREMTDRRGRAPGETAGLVQEGALEAGFDRRHLHVVLEEQEAIDYALAMGREGDVIVVGCADTHSIIDAVRRRATEFQSPTNLNVTWLPESEPADRPNS